ncbi:beta/gamma crystallin domain-containing protein [Streptomyces glaucus]|uniref:Streptomyces killer toxin-like beta/gamma crystallin domain-containing protein n=1 Tax=Streptomyces glaucus TaxID=284029 RepID=A0ABP5X5T1_9ACTN
MKRVTLRTSLAVVTAGVLAALVPAGPAAALNRTDCGTRVDFVKIWYDHGSHVACFANAGVQDVHLPHTVKVSSGNNSIRMVLGGEVLTMPKWTTKRDVDGSAKLLSRLRIF